jgi:hypothetical protein
MSLEDLTGMTRASVGSHREPLVVFCNKLNAADANGFSPIKVIASLAASGVRRAVDLPLRACDTDDPFRRPVFWPLIPLRPSLRSSLTFSLGKGHSRTVMSSR